MTDIKTIDLETAAATAAEEWRAIALSTAPIDHAAAEAAITALYAATLLDPAPEIIWCASPLAAAKLIASEPERFADPVRDQIRDATWTADRAQLVEQLGVREFGRIWQLACGSLAPTLSTLIGRVADAVEAAADDDTARRTALRIATTHAFHGQHDAAWLPLYEAAKPGTPLGRVAREVGWWWPFADRVVVTERPTAIHLDDLDRLHHGDGPALAYSDGFALYSWRGARLTAEFGAKLAMTTPQLIQEEENAELRRMMMEHFTPERFIKESDAQPLHADETGKLWQIAMADDEPIVLVEVVNSSPEPDGTFNVYFLRVPPTTRTAREGVAWTFGLTEDEYQPMAQT